MSMFLRIAWMMWLPPIESASPSPVAIQTERSGLAILIPVAIAGARPWTVWKPYVFM
jgi:hypothetical protein